MGGTKKVIVKHNNQVLLSGNPRQWRAIQHKLAESHCDQAVNHITFDFLVLKLIQLFLTHECNKHKSSQRYRSVVFSTTN